MRRVKSYTQMYANVPLYKSIRILNTISPAKIPLIPYNTKTHHIMDTLPINTISIEGWRSIKKVKVTFGNINILLGANGSGKSSFLSAFELLEIIVNNPKYLPKYIEKNGGANQNFHYGTKNTDHVMISIDIEKRHNYSYFLMAGKDDNIILSDKADVDFYLSGITSVHSQVAEFEKTPDLKEKLEELKNHFTLYHFQDTGATSPLKRVSEIFQTRYLHPDGDNLAAILYEIKNTHSKSYENIINAIRFAFPDFKDFIFHKTGDNVRLLWNDRYAEHYDFPLSALSDGTLRFIALSTLLLQPNPPKFIIIDEPELGLHPEAIEILAELIKLASANSQLLISTQSVQLVDCFTPDDILIAEKEHGETKITRPNKEELRDWLKDYTLGEIWRKNIMGGNP